MADTNETVDQQFEEIIRESIDKLSGVKCPIEAYVQALRYMQSELQICIEATGIKHDQVESDVDQR